MEFLKRIFEFIYTPDPVESINNHNGINHHSHFDNTNHTNPSTSLPMNGSVDIHGNPFGADNSISNAAHHTFNDFNNHYHHHNPHDAFTQSTLDHYNQFDPFKTY